MVGYLFVPNEKVPETFDAGFSMYIAAWPLLKQYPGQRFQSGLPGTWMFAQPVDKPLEKGYSDNDLIWNVPRNFTGKAATVVVQISDESGQEIAHRFQIAVNAR